MTARPPVDPRFEAGLTAWLTSAAPTAEPDGLLDRVLATTATTRRRPAWWTPGGAADLLVNRRTLGRGLALVATLTAVAIAALAIAVGSRPHVPLPPGRPGWIVAAEQGKLLLLDEGGSIRFSWDTGAYPGVGSWSPDGSRLAYVEGDPAQPDLVIRDDHLDEVLRLALPANAAPFVSWAPDGKRIAFGVETDADSRIHVIDVAAGAQAIPITDPALQAVRPSWSPDGSLIAFRGGVALDQQAVYAMRPDGSGVVRLTEAARAVEPFCGFPWTPDSRTIAFGTHFNGVWTVNGDGTNERQVTGLSDQAYCPSISPDGTRIAAMSWLDTGKYIVVMDLDGGHRVTPAGPLYDAWPAVWSPDGSLLVVNGRDLAGGPAPRAFLDPAGVQPARTIHLEDDAFVIGWQRLAP